MTTVNTLAMILLAAGVPAGVAHAQIIIFDPIDLTDPIFDPNESTGIEAAWGHGFIDEPPGMVIRIVGQAGLFKHPISERDDGRDAGFDVDAVSGLAGHRYLGKPLAGIWNMNLNDAPASSFTLLPEFMPDEVDKTEEARCGYSYDGYDRVAGVIRYGTGEVMPLVWGRFGEGPWWVDVLPHIGGQQGEEFAGAEVDGNEMFVGWSSDAGGLRRAVVWSRPGPAGAWSVVPLPPLALDRPCEARALTAMPLSVAGVAIDSDGVEHAVRWLRDAGEQWTVEVIPDLGGGGSAILATVRTPPGEAPMYAGRSRSAEGHWIGSIHYEETTWMTQELMPLAGYPDAVVHSGTWPPGELSYGGSSHAMGSDRTACVWREDAPGDFSAYDVRDLLSIPIDPMVQLQVVTDMRHRMSGTEILLVCGSLSTALAGDDGSNRAYMLVELDPLSTPTGGAAKPFGLSAVGSPFRSHVRILLPLGEDDAEVRVFDVFGREVRRLEGATGSRRSSVVWDGRDRAGRDLPNGVYFVRLEHGRYPAVPVVRMR